MFKITKRARLGRICNEVTFVRFLYGLEISHYHPFGGQAVSTSPGMRCEPSPGVKRQLLIKAIGEDELLEQLRQEYPALQDPAGSTPEAIVEGVAEMKMGCLASNDNTIADKLGLGRTTLWRMQKKSGAAKAKKEE